MTSSAGLRDVAKMDVAKMDVTKMDVAQMDVAKMNVAKMDVAKMDVACGTWLRWTCRARRRQIDVVRRRRHVVDIQTEQDGGK
jgi:hypothetical protein